MLLAVFACAVLPAVQVQKPEAAAKVEWVVMTPHKATSQASTRIEFSTDRVVVDPKAAKAKEKEKEKEKRKGKGKAKGKAVQKNKDVHIIEFDSALTEITGLRLEVNGAGRGKGGQWKISGVYVDSAPLNKPKRLRRSALIQAVAKSDKPKHRASALIDNNTATVWEGTKDNRVVLEFATPIQNVKGTRLVMTLEYHKHAGATIREFAVSATSDTSPLREVGNPFSEGWGAVQKRIDKAIERGCELLLEQQERDGSWRLHQPGYPSGQTALCVYALAKSGVPQTHISVRRAVEYLRSNQPKKTYSLALLILGLCSLDADRHREWIQKSVDELVSWQRRGWAYPGANVDMSNTQYAAIALRTAATKGIKVPLGVWPRLKDYAERCQERRSKSSGGPTSVKGGSPPRGFSYKQNGKATGSMTTSGVAILAICREQLKKRKSKSDNLASGLKWLVVNFTQTCNPEGHVPYAQHGNAGRLHYYLYGLERVGGLLDLNLLGPYDWYRKGAMFLIDTQAEDGRWGNQTNTCFALLFLSRATRASAGGPTTGVVGKIATKTIGKDDPKNEVSIRAAGNKPLTFWVSSYGTATHEDFEWPREKGRGPHVTRVEYFAYPRGEPKARHRIAIAEGDPKNPAGKLSYSAQHEFKQRGFYMISAEVTVVRPPPGGYEGAAWARLRAEKDRVAVLKSPPIEVLVRDADEIMTSEELFRYAKDPILNQLAGRKLETTASSELGKGWAAELVSDNLHSRAWKCKKDDKAPWVMIELRKQVRANIVLLSPALDFSKANAQSERNFSKVLVRINGGRGGAYEVEMTRDPRRKTVLELPKAVSIKTIRAEIMAKGQAEVGFAEIELQLQKR